jgi:hypothetical protein
MVDGDRFNILSIAYIHLTFGLWHWDLNPVMPLRLPCSHTHFTSYFPGTTLIGLGKYNPLFAGLATTNALP